MGVPQNASVLELSRLVNESGVNLTLSDVLSKKGGRLELPFFFFLSLFNFV